MQKPPQKRPLPVYQNCGQVGFWAMAWIAGSGEIVQWGRDGDTEHPEKTYQAALDRIRYLHEGETHKDDVFYVLNVFPNGQIRLDPIDRE